MASSLSPDRKKVEDEADVKSLRNGDRKATETFVRNHAPWMLALARRILKDEVPDDLVKAVLAARDA